MGVSSCDAEFSYVRRSGCLSSQKLDEWLEGLGKQHSNTMCELLVVQEFEFADQLIGFASICACCIGNQDVANGYRDNILSASVLNHGIYLSRLQ